MLRGTGMTRVEDQSTVWQNERASSGLMPASSSPASATCAMLISGGTLTVGLGDCTITMHESADSGGPAGDCAPPPEAGGCPGPRREPVRSGQLPYSEKTPLGM